MHPIERRRPTPKELRVGREHLSRLEDIHTLLSALSDPYASSWALTQHVARIPVLTARCIRRAMGNANGRELGTLEQVMTLIGNRGLEAELLQLLEDLTIKKFEEEGAAGRRRRR